MSSSIRSLNPVPIDLGGEEGVDTRNSGELPEVRMQSRRRNILIIGKTGAGKATIANKILGENKFHVSASVEGATKSIAMRQIDALIQKSDSETTALKYYHYTIRLIDTVGVSYRLNPQQIAEKIESFIEESPQGIHLVIFVFKNGHFTKEDQVAFNLFITSGLAKEISPISALVITCCEGLNDTARQELRRDFSSVPSIATFMQKNIYTVGFPNIDVVKVELKSFYEEIIETDKNTLKDLVAGCEKPVLVKHLSSERFQCPRNLKKDHHAESRNCTIL